MPQVGRGLRSRMCVDQRVSAVTSVEVSVFLCFSSSCYHVTEVGAVRFVRLTLKVVIKNDGDFVNIILLYRSDRAACC
jgi:hypothetical protein